MNDVIRLSTLKYHSSCCTQNELDKGKRDDNLQATEVIQAKRMGTWGKVTNPLSP